MIHYLDACTHASLVNEGKTNLPCCLSHQMKIAIAKMTTTTKATAPTIPPATIGITLVPLEEPSPGSLEGGEHSISLVIDSISTIQLGLTSRRLPWTTIEALPLEVQFIMRDTIDAHSLGIPAVNTPRYITAVGWSSRQRNSPSAMVLGVTEHLQWFSMEGMISIEMSLSFSSVSVN